MTTPITPKSPVSGKVWAATGSGGSLGIAVGLIIDFVPWLRTNIPPDAIPLIPPFLAGLGAFAGGYRATHRPTVSEIIAEVGSAESLIKAIEDAARPVATLTPTFSFAQHPGVQLPAQSSSGIHVDPAQDLQGYEPPAPTVPPMPDLIQDAPQA
jgi:hypothetical protein